MNHKVAIPRIKKPQPLPPRETETALKAERSWSRQEDDLLRSLVHIKLLGGLYRAPDGHTWARIAELMNDTASRGLPIAVRSFNYHNVRRRYYDVLRLDYETVAEHESRIADWEADMAVEKSRGLIAAAAKAQQRKLVEVGRYEVAEKKAIAAQLEEERFEEVAMEKRRVVRLEREWRAAKVKKGMEAKKEKEKEAKESKEIEEKEVKEKAGRNMDDARIKKTGDNIETDSGTTKKGKEHLDKAAALALQAIAKAADKAQKGNEVEKGEEVRDKRKGGDDETEEKRNEKKVRLTDNAAQTASASPTMTMLRKDIIDLTLNEASKATEKSKSPGLINEDKNQGSRSNSVAMLLNDEEDIYSADDR
jgi:hypothetical protein